MNYGNVIARIGREVIVTDLYNDERHTVTADGTATPLGKLLVRRTLSGARNDGLS